jgi:Flp pilus assembly protein TadG
MARCDLPVRRRDSFLRNTDGNASIEFVLWLPILVGLISLFTDAALILNGQAQAVRVAQDANRAYSVGRLQSPDATQQFVQDRLSHLSNRVEVSTSLSNGVIETVLIVPTRDLEAIGWFGTWTDGALMIVTQHMMES